MHIVIIDSSHNVHHVMLVNFWSGVAAFDINFKSMVELARLSPKSKSRGQTVCRATSFKELILFKKINSAD